MFNTKSLFPTPLENLRFLAQLCDLPVKNKKELDDIVYNKTIHPNKLNRIVNEIWYDNVKEVFPDEIVKTTSNAIIHHFHSYLDLVGEVAVDGLDRDKLQSILISFYFSSVNKVIRAFLFPASKYSCILEPIEGKAGYARCNKGSNYIYSWQHK